MNRDPLGTAAKWRVLAAAKSLSIRDLMIEVSSRQAFVGSRPAVGCAAEKRGRTFLDGA